MVASTGIITLRVHSQLKETASYTGATIHNVINKDSVGCGWGWVGACMAWESSAWES